MSLVDARIWSSEPFQRTHNHLGVLVAVEPLRRANDAEVDVARIVKDGASSGPPAHQLDGGVTPADTGRLLGNLRKALQVDLQPGILVAAEDDAGRVDVEREDGGVRRRDLEESVLDGEVEEGVGRLGEVDLDFVGGMGSWGCEMGEARY